MKTIKIKINERVDIPEYATKGSACFDLRADINENLIIGKGQIEAIPTGLFVEFDSDMVMLISARSGKALRGLVVANAPGVIDSDYRGEIKVILQNTGTLQYTVEPGEKIAQARFAPNIQVDFNVTDILSKSERGENGFGSTGA